MRARGWLVGSLLTFMPRTAAGSSNPNERVAANPEMCIVSDYGHFVRDPVRYGWPRIREVVDVTRQSLLEVRLPATAA